MSTPPPPSPGPRPAPASPATPAIPATRAIPPRAAHPRAGVASAAGSRLAALLLGAACVAWTATPLLRSGLAGTALAVAVIAVVASALRLAFIDIPLPEDQYFVSGPLRAWLSFLAVLRTVPWEEVAVVALLWLEIQHPSRPWHTAALGAGLLAYLLTAHIAESGADAAPLLRRHAKVLVLGAVLLAVGAGFAMIPAGTPGARPCCGSSRPSRSSRPRPWSCPPEKNAVRPLQLPDEAPARDRRRRPARRWLGWGAPVAAAALVTALALTLVLVRQAGGPPAVPAVSGAVTAPAVPASVPRYYVALQSPGGSPAAGAVVADDRTGRTLAVVPAPAGQAFTGVTGAADDRTFVLTSYQAATRQTTAYRLLVTPGAAPVTRLVKLPVKPLTAQPSGLALSPDGRELAVMVEAPRLELRVYSLSSGAMLGNWSTSTSYWVARAGGANAFGLSWLSGGRVSFRFDEYAAHSLEHLVTVRTLDPAAAGHDLLGASRLVLQVPLAVATASAASASAARCFTSLAVPDGSAIVCGGLTTPGPGGDTCPAALAPLVSYPAGTSPRPRVLYEVLGRCVNATALWTDDAARHVIALLTTAAPNGTGPAPTVIGLVSDGRLIPLTAMPASARAAASLLGGIAF